MTSPGEGGTRTGSGQVRCEPMCESAVWDRSSTTENRLALTLAQEDPMSWHHLVSLFTMLSVSLEVDVEGIFAYAATEESGL